MSDKEMLEYAKDLKQDIQFALLEGEGEIIVTEKDLKRVTYLIQQAEKVERYEQALKDVYSKTFIMSSYAGLECNQIIEKVLEIKY